MEKKHFVKTVTIFVIVLLKMTLCLCIGFVFTKKPIILRLFKINTLNFTMYGFNDFDMLFKNIPHRKTNQGLTEVN